VNSVNEKEDHDIYNRRKAREGMSKEKEYATMVM